MKPFGIALVALAILGATVAQLNNCAQDDKALTLADGRQVPMKCYWTAQAELGVALPLAATGAVLALSRRRETIRGLAAMGVVLGALVILLPTSLIGVCSGMTASCNLIMKPAMMFAGTLTILASVGALASAQWRLAVAEVEA